MIEPALDYRLLLLLPLLAMGGAVLSFTVGKWRPNLSGWIATLTVAVCVLLSLHLKQQLLLYSFLEYRAFSWIESADLVVDFTLRFDQLSAVMCLVVTAVGFLIHLYAVGYMASDSDRPRFFCYFNLFIAAMLLLVLAGNFLVLFAGWEGVGLCSYLLIGFWYQKRANASAGRKAFIINRIGDMGFLIGIFLVYTFLGSLDFHELGSLLSQTTYQFEVFTLIGLCLFIGAVGKSAQLPLMVWLPDAMAGPTPVSALIHAATMVTAGIYMLARLHFLYTLAPLATAVICWTAVVTALVAAAIALVQNDLKRVLAYSTISQLGFMFVAAALGAYSAAVFHLATHAVFKATLFLTAGSVIHACHHQQDQRLMGGLKTIMPITCWSFLLAGLALAGIFPFSGYYSKHAIFEAFSGMQNEYLDRHVFTLKLMLTVTAVMTGFYAARTFVMVFLGEYRGNAKPHEVSANMLLPQGILAVFALVAGVGLVSYSGLFDYLAACLPSVKPISDGEPWFAFILHSWPGLLGVGLSYFLYRYAPLWPARIFKGVPGVGQLLKQRFLLDELYQVVIIKPAHSLARLLWRRIDILLVDGTINGIAAMLELNGEVLRRLQSGQVRQYAFLMMMALAVIWGLYLSF